MSDVQEMKKEIELLEVQLKLAQLKAEIRETSIRNLKAIEEERRVKAEMLRAREAAAKR